MSLNNNVIKIGTRKSKLALAQTQLVIDEIKRKFPDVIMQIVPMSTKGDRLVDKSLVEFGGKAVFVEEFEKAIMTKDIDIAVHSAKDMPMEIMEGLVIAGTLKRACPKDVLIYKEGTNPCEIKEFVVGTSSLRRQYQIKNIYPNARCQNLRGNINTRLDKLKSGQYDAIILAAAGIQRLGIDKEEGLHYEYLSEDDMVPAACQAIIAVQTRKSGKAYEIAKAINDEETYTQLLCERQVLKELKAGCHEPIGAYSQLDNENVTITLLEVKGEDNHVIRKKVSGLRENYIELVKKIISDK